MAGKSSLGPGVPDSGSDDMWLLCLGKSPACGSPEYHGKEQEPRRKCPWFPQLTGIHPRTMAAAVAGTAFRHLLSTGTTTEALSLACLVLVTDRWQLMAPLQIKSPRDEVDL